MFAWFLMEIFNPTRTHLVENSASYSSWIDYRQGFERPPYSVQYYGPLVDSHHPIP